MLEFGHKLALETAARRAWEAALMRDGEKAIVAVRQIEAVSRIEQASKVVFRDLGIPDIALDFDAERENAEEMLQDAGFAESLKYFLAKRDLNSRQFALQSGISESMINKLTGNSRDPGLSTFAQVIDGFGWTIDNWEARLLFNKAIQHTKKDANSNP